MALHRYTQRALIALLVFFAYSTLGSASTTPFRSLQSNKLEKRDADDTPICTINGNSDYYGLGVRMGYYATWITSAIANNFLPSEMAGALDQNAIFLLSLMVSIFYGTRSQALTTIDGLILMHLASGFLFGVFSVWGYRTVHYYKDGPTAIRFFGGFGTHFRLLLTLSISAYGVWFWTRGIHGGLTNAQRPDTDPTTCPETVGPDKLVTFFFGKLHILGGIDTWFIIVCIGCTAYFGLMLVASMFAWTFHYIRIVSGRRTDSGRPKFETGLSHPELNLSFAVFRWFNFSWLFFCAIMIELTIVWNRVYGVRGEGGELAYPGQLIPFLIGAGGFIRILWLLFIDLTSPKEEDCCAEDNAMDMTEQSKDTRIKPQIELPINPTGPVRKRATFGPSLGHNLRQVFTPSTASAAPTAVNTSQPYSHPQSGSEIRRKPHVRYLVGWLPWLALFPFWTNAYKRAYHHGEEGGQVGTAAPGPVYPPTSIADDQKEARQSDPVEKKGAGAPQLHSGYTPAETPGQSPQPANDISTGWLGHNAETDSEKAV